MTTHTLGNLAIKRFISPDGNWFNPDRIQVSDAPRHVEQEGDQHMAYGVAIAAPHPHLNIMNGQRVDVATMLMCSRCCRWKKDDDFSRDKYRIVRRKRSYYCRGCMAQMNAGYREARRA